MPEVKSAQNTPGKSSNIGMWVVLLAVPLLLISVVVGFSMQDSGSSGPNASGVTDPQPVDLTNAHTKSMLDIVNLAYDPSAGIAKLKADLEKPREDLDAQIQSQLLAADPNSTNTKLETAKAAAKAKLLSARADYVRISNMADGTNAAEVNSALNSFKQNLTDAYTELLKAGIPGARGKVVAAAIKLVQENNEGGANGSHRFVKGSWDCSGFVNQAFQAAFPGVSELQLSGSYEGSKAAGLMSSRKYITVEAKSYSVADIASIIQPGDLILNKYGAVYHVVMYIGPHQDSKGNTVDVVESTTGKGNGVYPGVNLDGPQYTTLADRIKPFRLVLGIYRSPYLN